MRQLLANDVTGDDVRKMVVDFMAQNVPARSDGQIDRAAQRLGLIAAAGELTTAMGIVPWQPGEALDAAAWALGKWIEGRGGTEPAEVRQAIEQVRLFIEQHGESRFEALDDTDARAVNNRAGWRRGGGSDREWMVPPEVWKSEICNGLDSTIVARTLAGRGMLRRGPDQFATVVKIGGQSKRVFVLTSAIIDGKMRNELAQRLRSVTAVSSPKRPVTTSTPVTRIPVTASMPLKLLRLPELLVSNSKAPKRISGPVTSPVTVAPEPDVVELEERKAMATDGVLELYLDAWGRLQCQKPIWVSDADWR